MAEREKKKALIKHFLLRVNQSKIHSEVFSTVRDKNGVKGFLNAQGQE